MKKTLMIFGAAGLLLASCQDAPKADEATTTEAKEVAQTGAATHTADLAQTKVEFIGTKPVGSHHGTITLKEGQLNANGGIIQSGKFVFDMNTLQTDDQDADGNAKLTGHLKNEDFFDVTNYPEAVFEITSVAEGVTADEKDLVMKDATHTVTGNLTMKGVTKSISFPAKIVGNDTQVTADASFNIDRTQWNLNYNSDKSLGDKFINPEVNLKLHLVANKM